jgi:hypothetical protein
MYYARKSLNLKTQLLISLSRGIPKTGKLNKLIYVVMIFSKSALRQVFMVTITLVADAQLCSNGVQSGTLMGRPKRETFIRKGRDCPCSYVSKENDEAKWKFFYSYFED